MREKGARAGPRSGRASGAERYRLPRSALIAQRDLSRSALLSLQPRLMSLRVPPVMVAPTPRRPRVLCALETKRPSGGRRDVLARVPEALSIESPMRKPAVLTIKSRKFTLGARVFQPRGRQICRGRSVDFVGTFLAPVCLFHQIASFTTFQTELTQLLIKLEPRFFKTTFFGPLRAGRQNFSATHFRDQILQPFKVADLSRAPGEKRVVRNI